MMYPEEHIAASLNDFNVIPFIVFGVILTFISLVMRTRSWTYLYGYHHITISFLPHFVELRVNGVLQDKKDTLIHGELNGKLDSGEEIRVVVSRYFSANCLLFIDDKVQEPI